MCWIEKVNGHGNRKVLSTGLSVKSLLPSSPETLLRDIKTICNRFIRLEKWFPQNLHGCKHWNPNERGIPGVQSSLRQHRVSCQSLPGDHSSWTSVTVTKTCPLLSEPDRNSLEIPQLIPPFQLCVPNSDDRMRAVGHPLSKQIRNAKIKRNKGWADKRTKQSLNEWTRNKNWDSENYTGCFGV